MSNDNTVLTVAATEIMDLVATVQKANGDALEANRSIGAKLLEAKAILDSAGKGAFGKWCDDSGFGFSRQWRSQLMSLAANWKAIKKAMGDTPTKSVEKAVSLVRAQPIKKGEQDKLLALLATAEAGGEEGDKAQKKLERAAKAHNVTPADFTEKLDAIREKAKAAAETPKEKPEETIARLSNQLARLLDLLTEKGIDPSEALKETSAPA